MSSAPADLGPPTIPTALQGPTPAGPAGSTGATPDSPAAPQPGPGGDAGMTDADRRRMELHDDHQGPPSLFWFRSQYLYWWLKEGPLPEPLLTTGSVEGAGVISSPDTVVLLGQSKIDYGQFNGVRLETGVWLNDSHTWGLEGGGFLLEQRSRFANFSSDAAGNPVLARPFNDFIPVGAVPPFTPTSIFVSAPGGFTGSFAFATSSRLWGAEANLVRNLVSSPRVNLDLLLGFRYLDLEEDLEISQTTQALEGGELFFNNLDPTNPIPLDPSSTLTIVDRFHTRNQFYGGQIGGRLGYRWGPVVLNLSGKVAMGPNHEAVDVTGTTTATTPTGVSSLPSGMLAIAGTNTGRATTNWFVVVPEANFEVGYQINRFFQVYVGYDFLYVNNIARPGNQITTNLNSALIPTTLNFNSMVGPALPVLPMRKEDFWAQGIHVGMEFRY
jgi:hypothetical protein